MSIEVKVPSSSSENFYVVAIEDDGHATFVTCTCAAGTFGKLCKHKARVLRECLNGNAKGLVGEKVVAVQQLLQNAGILALLREFDIAEQEAERTKRSLDSARKRLENQLKGMRGER